MRQVAAVAVAALASLAAVAAPGAAHAGAAAGSILALPALTPEATPRLVVAQRAITRAWGPSEDSVYVVVTVPGWRSEGWAAVMSAAVPGAGQAYAGEGSGLWFALAEIAGWTARAVFRRDAEDRLDEAVAFAGSPTDSGAAWSFARWAERSDADPAELAAVYARDPGAFWQRIASDPAYAAGWRGGGDALRLEYKALHDRSQRAFKRARYAGNALWLNHVVAAVDALRAARIHNLPLRQNVRVALRGGWRHDGPALVAALERRF